VDQTNNQDADILVGVTGTEDDTPAGMEDTVDLTKVWDLIIAEVQVGVIGTTEDGLAGLENKESQRNN
jgi:hypothetical protein